MADFNENMRKALDDMAQATLKGIAALRDEADKLVDDLHKKMDQVEREHKARELFEDLGRKIHALMKDGKLQCDDPAVAEVVQRIDKTQ